MVYKKIYILKLIKSKHIYKRYLLKYEGYKLYKVVMYKEKELNIKLKFTLFHLV